MARVKFPSGRVGDAHLRCEMFDVPLPHPAMIVVGLLDKNRAFRVLTGNAVSER